MLFKWHDSIPLKQTTPLVFRAFCFKFVYNLNFRLYNRERSWIQGRVIVRFVVTKTGKVSNVEVMRGVDPPRWRGSEGG